MSEQTRDVEISLSCAYEQAYDYLCEPSNFSQWAAGLGSIKRKNDGTWRAESPGGAATLEFAARNADGVLDHTVRPDGGEAFTVPMRLSRDGSGCRLVLTLKRLPSMTDASFDGDAASVKKDFAALKKILETGGKK